MPIVRANRPERPPAKSTKLAKPQPVAAIVTAKHPRRWRYEPAEQVPDEEADAKAKRFVDRMMRPPGSEADPTKKPAPRGR